MSSSGRWEELRKNLGVAGGGDRQGTVALGSLSSNPGDGKGGRRMLAGHWAYKEKRGRRNACQFSL